MALTRSVAMDLGLSQIGASAGAGSGKSASASDIAALGKARSVVDAHLAKHTSRIPSLDETINGELVFIFSMSLLNWFICSICFSGVYTRPQRSMGAVLHAKSSIAPRWSV
jgi:hypothetical protein